METPSKFLKQQGNCAFRGTIIGDPGTWPQGLNSAIAT